mgnify:CR=1 FL=1
MKMNHEGSIIYQFQVSCYSTLAKIIDFVGFHCVQPNLLISNVNYTVSVDELKSHLPQLRQLNEWYRQNVDLMAITTKVYYETKPTKIVLTVIFLFQ